MSKQLAIILLTASFAWGQQVALSGQYTLSGQAQTAAQAIYFQNGYEEGNFSGWSGSAATDCTTPAGSAVAVQSSEVHSGTYAARFTYIIQASPTNGCLEHEDSNTYSNRTIAGGGLTNEFYVRFWAHGHVNAGGTGSSNDVGRKLLYMKSDSVSQNYDFAVILTTTQSSSPVIRVFHDGGGLNPCSAHASQTHTSTKAWLWDTWQMFEVYVKLNTPGVVDGQLRLWVDGVEETLTNNPLAVNLRGTCSTGITRFELGRQVDRFLDANIDEVRDLDDFVVASSYIGP